MRLRLHLPQTFAENLFQRTRGFDRSLASFPRLDIFGSHTDCRCESRDRPAEREPAAAQFFRFHADWWVPTSVSLDIHAIVTPFRRCAYTRPPSPRHARCIAREKECDRACGQ